MMFNPGMPGMGFNKMNQQVEQMPAHIQILFTARPPLPQLKPPHKGKCRKLDPIFSKYIDYTKKLEEYTEKYPEIEYEPPLSKREQIKAERKKKLEEHKEKINELAKDCIQTLTTLHLLTYIFYLRGSEPRSKGSRRPT